METQCVIGSPEWMRSVDRRLTELNRKVTELSIPKITINPSKASGNFGLIEEHPDFELAIAKAFAWLDDSNNESLKSEEHYKIKANVFISAFKHGGAGKVFCGR